jgi:hypothetical protein
MYAWKRVSIIHRYHQHSIACSDINESKNTASLRFAEKPRLPLLQLVQIGSVPLCTLGYTEGTTLDG